MAKLKDDYIRWILSLDAKGLQGELNTLSSSTSRLTKENKELSSELKTAEKYLRDAEKAVSKLEAAGKTNTKQYKLAKAEVEDHTLEIVRMSNEMKENTKTIDENNKKQKEIIETMKIEDMTMSQLRQRSRELQKQLNDTSVAADPKAYKALQKELGQVKNRMFDVNNTGKNMMQQFASMHNPVGQAAKGVLGLNQAFKSLLANPIALAIVVIVGLFASLYKVLQTSEEATHKLNQIMAPLKVLFDAILNVLQKIVISLLDFAMAVVNGFTKVLSVIPGVSKAMEKVNEKAREGIELEKAKQQVEINSRKLLVENAARELEISKLRNDAKKKDTLSEQERMDALNKALELEEQITAAKVDQAKETLRIAEAELKRAGNTKEKEENLAQLRAEVFRAEKEFYDKTRRLESERSDLVLSMQREREQKAKEALEKRIKNEENALNQGINNLKQARLQGLLTESEYNRKVEELSIKSLQNQLNIKGLDKDKQVALQAQLYDILIQEKQKYEKLLADTSIETSILTDEYNTKLKLAGVYNADINKLTKEQLEEKKRIENEYQSKLTDIAIKGEDERYQIALKEAGVDGDRAQLTKEQLEVLELLNKHHKANLQKIEDDYDKGQLDRQKSTDAALLQSLQQAAQARLSTIDAIEKAKLSKLKSDLANGIITQEYYDSEVKRIERESAQRRLEKQKKFVEEFKKISNPTDEQIKALEAAEAAVMDAQDKINDEKIKQEKEFQEKKQAVVQSYIQQTNEMISAASNFIQALQSAETAAIQADYEKRLSALSESDADYAQKKERIEQDRAQAELDIQKKFADAQFAIQVAQIGVATATGIMNAWASSMTIPPPFGQIMAGVLTALLVGTGIAQVAAANKERQKIKSMTLSSPGSSSGSSLPATTGQVVLNEGLADGGYNHDFSDGGYTGPGRRYDVAGTLPVHSGEYVVAVPELRRPDVAEKVRSIEMIRRRRTNKNPLPEGFAEGGANVGSNVKDHVSPYIMLDNSTVKDLVTILRDIRDGKVVVKTYYGITELQAAQKEKFDYESKLDLQ